jgi:hypothetical protein
VKEDIIAKKRIALSNVELTRVATAMEGLGNSKREPIKLQKRPKHDGKIQLTKMNHLP